MDETKPRRNWKALEIVNDKAVPVEPEAPVTDALQAAADAPLPPDPEELIAAQPELAGPEITVIVRVEPLKVERLEQARALPEITNCAPGEVSLVSDGIQSFKSTDGRTMLVVVRDGNLYSQEK